MKIILSLSIKFKKKKKILTNRHQVWTDWKIGKIQQFKIIWIKNVIKSCKDRWVRQNKPGNNNFDQIEINQLIVSPNTANG
jgi:hypothetical protein